jgi:conjugal transfer/entry exclusion protein
MAYDVQQIQTEFARQYKSIDLTGRSARWSKARESRWQNSVAAFEDALKVQAGAVSNIEGYAHRGEAWSPRASRRPARCRRPRPGTSCWRCSRSSSPT